MKKIKPRVILKANRKWERVGPDADSAQGRLEVMDRMETIAAIKLGLESMKGQRGKPATDFFREFFAEEGITHLE